MRPRDDGRAGIAHLGDRPRSGDGPDAGTPASRGGTDGDEDRGNRPAITPFAPIDACDAPVGAANGPLVGAAYGLSVGTAGLRAEAVAGHVVAESEADDPSSEGAFVRGAYDLQMLNGEQLLCAATCTLSLSLTRVPSSSGKS